MYILFLVSIGINIFLAKELLKKFGFWKRFQKNHTNQISWSYQGDKTTGMYTIELRGKKSFCGIIGFDFSIGCIKNIGYDVFGYFDSNDENIAQISTYLGKGGVTFIFLIDGVDVKDIEIFCIGISQGGEKYIFKPHWWQRIHLPKRN